MEALRFDSREGDFLSLVILEFQRAGAGLNTIIGGAGRDILYTIQFTPGDYTMPQLSFQNWSTDLNDPNNDFVILLAGSNDNYTLRAREGLSSIQGLRGGGGNDLLIGSSGSDSLDGRLGVNELYGNGGDDWLFAENYTPFGGVAASNTFAGNIFNGGTDYDTLLVGGPVNFQGSLIDIENIYFQPARPAPVAGTSGLDPAYLILSSGVANGLPANLNLSGTGTLEINLTAGQSFNGSAYTFSPTASVAVVINGTSGNDVIAGTSGDDEITTGGGQDSIQAGEGNDSVILNGVLANGSNLNGGLGTDTLEATAAAVNPFGFVALGQSTISGFETLSFGTSVGEQLVVGLNPFQGGLIPDQPVVSTIFSNVEGGSGTDILIIGLPNTPGTYWMPTLTFNNWSSNDLFILSGGGNNASYTLRTNNHDGRYVLAGANGNDTLIGSEGVESLIGNNGADLLQGEGGDDYLEGGAGNDKLEGGAGNDTLAGGADSDIFDISEGQDIVTDFVIGVDKIDVSDADFTSFDQLLPYLSEVNGSAVWSFLYNGVINTLTLQGIALASLSADDFVFASPAEANNESGTDNADTLLGSDVDDSLNGLGGDDFLFGNDGNDILYGSGGGDTIYGGAGNDQIIGGFSPTSAPQPGDGADYLDGGSGNDLLRGGDGNDTLLGGADDDNLRGDDGADIIDGGDGFDNVSFNLFDLAGPVTVDMRNVTGGSTVQLVNDGRGNLDSLSNIERIIVNATNESDVVWGSLTLNNQLGGNDGNDTLRGGNVDDLIEGGNDNDLLFGNGGGDTIYGGAGDDLLVGGFSPTSLPQPGDGADYLDGGDGNDQLRGGDGNDTLLGGAGNDNLRGDGGADIIDGGDGSDVVSFNLFDLSGPITVDMRNVTGSTTVQLVDDGRGNLDSLSNIESLIVNATNASDIVWGSTTLNNQLGGNNGDDYLYGGNLDDLIEGGRNNDTIDGGGGVDTATLVGAIEDFTIEYLGNASWRITDNGGNSYDNGVDIITNVEQLRLVPVEFSSTFTTVVLDAPPEAQNQSVVLDEDQSASGQAEAVDLENGTLSFTLVQGPANGSLSFNEDGTFLYTPNPDYFGDDSFTFTASDGVNTSSVATVALSVNPTPDAALIGGQQSGEITEGNISGAPSGQIAGLLSISDPDGPTQFVSAVTAGVYGSLALLANGTWTYTLDESSPLTDALNVGTTVTDSIEVAAEDGTTSLVTITIRGSNDSAIIGGATSGSALESALLGGTSQATGSLTISDVDNPPLFVAAVIAGLYGSFSINASGSWTYTVNNTNPLVDALSDGESLQESFTVFAADGTSQLVSLTVNGSNDIRNGTNQANNLLGTAGNDTLSGLGGNDILNGGLGNDILDGGAGTDTATYAGLGSGVTVNLSVVGPQNTGGGGIDSLVGIENIEGTIHNDVLTGNASANTILGGAGDDVIEGGAGSDTLNGGDGIDTVSYASATSAVTVNLSTTSSQNTGGAGGDSLSFFENLIGSAFADRLTGNSGANRIEGGNGADRIAGGGGADQLYGGASDDIFAFSTLLDSLPTSYDTIFDFEGAGITGGDIIDLSAIDAISGGKNNAFIFIGEDEFSGVAGQLRQDSSSTPGFTIVQGDTNGDGIADFQFAVAWRNEGADPVILGAQDFIL